MLSSEQHRRADAHEAQGLLKELPASALLLFENGASPCVVIERNRHRNSYVLPSDGCRKEAWMAWELPRLNDYLGGVSGGKEYALFVSLVIRASGGKAPQAVDCCLMGGEPCEKGLDGLRRLTAESTIHSDGGFMSAVLRVAPHGSSGKMHLAVRIKQACGPLDICVPEVVWRDEEKLPPEPCLVHLFSSYIEDFTLYINGWARDVLRPGLPVRLALLVNGVEKQRFLARTDGKAVEALVPPGAFTFGCSCFLAESELHSRIAIAVLDGTGKYARKITVTAIDQKAFDRQRLATGMVPDDAVVRGTMDSITRSRLRGWALSKKYPDRAVGLLLFLNETPFAYTQCFQARADVQKKHGGDGYSGYIFDLPPNLAVSSSVTARVDVCSGVQKLKRSVVTLDAPAGAILPASGSVDWRYRPVPAPDARKKISVIIINQNGAPILDEMLRSAEKVHDYREIEWVVVDHQSSDGSSRVCQDARMRGFDIHFLRRNGNFSFSDSNNYGVRHAVGEIVVFANNDLLFVEPFSQAIRRYLSDPAIGAVGVKLLDHVPVASQNGKAPVQHLGVFFNPYWIKDCIRPYEARLVEELAYAENEPLTVPCVTAAFMAVRREDFERTGGFDTGYIYGLEDVDLCLKLRATLGKSIVCANDLAVIHRRGFSRKSSGHPVIRKNNNRQLNAAWAGYLRDSIRRDMVQKPAFWTGNRPVVAFIVSDVGDATSAGEFYTALEFGKALQKLLPVHLRFLPKEHWYDLRGVDVLIVMVKPFDIGKVKNAGPFMLAINWMRQWFDAWADDPGLHAYDYLFASSQKAADYITAKSGRQVDVLPIASNVEGFSSGRFTPEFACDYCFTGSFFKMAREIQFQLDPEAVKGKGAVFGHHWEGTPFAPVCRGAVPYSRLPDVYASTKIVIDDANIATKPWGSCNSRVFDALAAGCLVMTNGSDGVQELFGGLVPTFDDKKSLSQGLNYWLDHEEERRERVKRLREIVLAEHTYDNRARHFVEVLEKRPRPVRIAIKCPAIFEERAHWGDYHFADALAAELRKIGYAARVDCRETWHSGMADTDDAVLVLRGLLPYKPKMHQYNMLWLISHPNDVSTTELLEYDQVYCASAYHSELLADSCRVPVSFLPQCVDTGRFHFIPERVNTKPDRVLFVGNSRGVFRDSVRWAVEKNLDIDVYGNGWEPFLKDNRLKGRLIPNEVLAEAYAASKYVLCDHWEDMKRLGYVSNRVFDVLAVGGKILVDDVRGLAELIPSGYEVFDNADTYRKLVSASVRVDLDERRALAEWIAEKHSFAVRARMIDRQVRKRLPGILLGRERQGIAAPHSCTGEESR